MKHFFNLCFMNDIMTCSQIKWFLIFTSSVDAQGVPFLQETQAEGTGKATNEGRARHDAVPRLKLKITSTNESKSRLLAKQKKQKIYSSGAYMYRVEKCFWIYFLRKVLDFFLFFGCSSS